MLRRRLALMLCLLFMAALAGPARSRAAEPLVPLVLIHGHGLGPEETWGVLIDHLQEWGYREGENLFTLDLTETGGQDRPLGLLWDAAEVARQLAIIRQATGADQVDLAGHSRGGLLVRLLTAGETAPLVRRAVTLNAPHAGLLSTPELRAVLSAAGLDLTLFNGVDLPADLQAGSGLLSTMLARERRFADQRPVAMAIGSTWPQGLPPILSGHDGLVAVASQLAWPGALTRLVRLGPSPEELAEMLESELAPLLLVWSSPHMQSLESPAVAAAMGAFLRAPRLHPPLRACEPLCHDFADLRGHWAEPELRALLAQGVLPYQLRSSGERAFLPDEPATLAELVYGMVRISGLPERLGPESAAALTGHWAFGFVEAAQAGGLLERLPGPAELDRPLTRAEAARLVLWAAAWPVEAEVGASRRFGDTLGHPLERWVEAGARAGLLRGDGERFRPDQLVTRAEAALLLQRALGRSGMLKAPGA